MKEWVNHLLAKGMRCHLMPMVDAVVWLKPRGHAPGLIKVESGSVAEKVMVLYRNQRFREDEC